MKWTHGWLWLYSGCLKDIINPRLRLNEVSVQHGTVCCFVHIIFRSVIVVVENLKLISRFAVFSIIFRGFNFPDFSDDPHHSPPYPSETLTVCRSYQVDKNWSRKVGHWYLFGRQKQIHWNADPKYHIEFFRHYRNRATQIKSKSEKIMEQI